MADYLNGPQLYNWAIEWIRSNVLIATNAEQLATVAAIFVCFLFFVRPLNRFFVGMTERFSVRAVHQILAQRANVHRHRVEQASYGAEQTRDIQRGDYESQNRKSARQPVTADKTRAELNDDPGKREAFGEPQNCGAKLPLGKDEGREPEG
jgi:hypothetical protein